MSDHLPAYTQTDIKSQLIESGASGTIYAFPFPESRQIYEEVLDGGNRGKLIEESIAMFLHEFNANAAPARTFSVREANEMVVRAGREVNAYLAERRRELTDIFEAAWTGRQDPVNVHFFEAWKNWSAPAASLADEHWNYMYPTEGASSGLKTCIEGYGNLARAEGFAPVIHVFHGEYEGFGAYATGSKIPVVKHDRHNWRETISQIGPTDQFYISQPSAIDGNVWNDFEEFAKTLSDTQPRARIILDLTYVGSVAKNYHINADHPNISTVVFSLSKPFGVYYQRIGGLLSREPLDNLFGNKWFKILQSLQVGTALLERSDVFALPQKYVETQKKAVHLVNQRLGLHLEPADVLMFATSNTDKADSNIKSSLLRGTPGREFMRICVTPEMVKQTPGAVYIEAGQNEITPPSAIHGINIREMKI